MSQAILGTRLTPRRRGALLVAGATLAWSTSGVITRLAHTDAWTILFWRSLFAFLFLAGAVALYRGGARSLLHLGATGWGVAVSFALSMVTFIVALQQTSVAHVLIFQAAAPFFAALLAWRLLREAVNRAMMAAIAASFAGIGVMVSASLLRGHWLGDALSLVMALSFAVVIVLSRLDRSVDMLTAACAATLLAGVVAAPFAHYHVGARELMLLAGFGIGQMGIALLMFTAGVRLLPAADAGLISVLEAVLAPLWTWLAVGENPGLRTLAGGAIVVAAVVGYGVSTRE